MNDTATFSVFYTFLHSLPTVSVIFDLLALFLAYHFKNSRIFYIVLSFLFLKCVHIVESLYQAHLIISMLLPVTYMIMIVNNDKTISLNSSFIRFGYLVFVLLFAVFISNVTAFNSDISSNIFNSKIIYKFFKPISELSFVIFWFFLIIIIAYIFVAQINIIYFISYFLSYTQFLFYSDSSAVAYYEFSSACFVVYFMILSYKAMFYDQLTNILNRRAYDRLISNDYYLAIVDIDHFKKINDTYGHDVGDLVLKFVAKLMKKVCKKGRVYRLGGEEFVIIYEKLDEFNVLKMLEQFRVSLENQKIKFNGNTIKVTVSMGVSKNVTTKDDTLKLADDKLYKAKENGRNQIVY